MQEKDIRNFECEEFVCSKSQSCIMATNGKEFCRKICYSNKCDLCFIRNNCKNTYERNKIND